MRKPRLFERLEQKARRVRFASFAKLLAGVNRPITILDVGGTYAYWKAIDYKTLGEVEFVLLNLFPQENLPPAFSAVVGNGKNLEPYSDDQFDVVFSNSVINMMGCFRGQEQLAKEIRRVGQRYFVQTPNQRFLMDWRTMIPFFHFLPANFQAWFFRRLSLGHCPRVRDHAKSLEMAKAVRNLTRRELTILFPGGNIIPERVFGMIKSFMVHDGFGESQNASLGIVSG
jgi:hypothetical protein